MTNANAHQDKWSNWSLKSMGFVSQLDQDFVLGHSVGSFIHLVQRCTTCIPKRSSHKRTSWMSQKLENSTHQSMDARKKVWLWFNIHFFLVFKMRTSIQSFIMVRPVCPHQAALDLAKWPMTTLKLQRLPARPICQEFQGMPFRFSESCFLFSNMCGGVDSETLSPENQQSTTSERSCQK